MPTIADSSVVSRASRILSSTLIVSLVESGVCLRGGGGGGVGHLLVVALVVVVLLNLVVRHGRTSPRVARADAFGRRLAVIAEVRARTRNVA